MNIFKKIEGDLKDLTFDQNASLDRILEHIRSLIFEEGISAEVREKRLSEIDKYLAKKARQRKTELVGDKSEYLRSVRNSIVHNSTVSLSNLDNAMPIFWVILGKSAPYWDSAHLEHLLSYALRRKCNLSDTEEATSKNVVQYYKRAFDKLPINDKRDVFKSLLFSIYISNEFQQVLGKKPRVRPKENKNEN